MQEAASSRLRQADDSKLTVSIAAEPPHSAPSVSAIVPAFNERERIANTVAALWNSGCCDEVIVVDDGSTDNTASQITESRTKLIMLDRNAGKGNALNRGASESSGDVLLLIDADLGRTAEQASCLIGPVIDGDADMTIALFPVIPGRGGGSGLVVRLARWGIRRATGCNMQSPLSGQRAMRKSVWEKVGGFESGFGAEVALTIDALRAGFKVSEVQTSMDHRVTGRDLASIVHRSKQFLAVARALWKRRGAILRGPQ